MKSILVICTRQIGDVLLTTPLIAAAHREWPDAKIDVLGFAGTLGMLSGNSDVNATIETPPRLGFKGFVSLVRRIWRRYDLALVTEPSDRAHQIGWLSSSTRSGIVSKTGSSNWWKAPLLRHVVTSAGDLGRTHVVDEKLRLLSYWTQSEQVQVRPPEPVALPENFDPQANAIVVHAPSMWEYKQWPIAHYKVLVLGLLERGHQVILTGSSSPRDLQCIAQLRDIDSPPRLLDAVGKLNFGQLVTLLSRCYLYIGPDTSVTHLAVSVGAPSIALFGPTNPMRWGPMQSTGWPEGGYRKAASSQRLGSVTILQATSKCVPCGRAGCRDINSSHSECLEKITPVKVLAAIDERRLGLQQACSAP